MSFTDEPLEIWLSRDEAGHEARLAVRHDESLAEMRAALDQLQEMLDHPPAKGANLMNSRVYGLGRWSIVRLPLREVTRAEDLYCRVYATGGAGTTYVQEGLLFIIGASRQPASILFWLETLNLSRPRDSFTTKRRTLALAALAYLAAHDCLEAEPLWRSAHNTLTSTFERRPYSIGVRSIWCANSCCLDRSPRLSQPSR